MRKPWRCSLLTADAFAIRMIGNRLFANSISYGLHHSEAWNLFANYCHAYQLPRKNNFYLTGFAIATGNGTAIPFVVFPLPLTNCTGPVMADGQFDFSKLVPPLFVESLLVTV